jgi:hypothetical protein
MAKLFRELEILYEALGAKIGVEVEILGNYQTSLQALYKAKNSSPEFDCIQINKSPRDSTKLWIIKNPAKGKEVQENPTPNEPLFSLDDL